MNTKEKILKTLKDFGRLPTYKIAAIVGMNPEKAKKVLLDMWEAGEIQGEVETVATYWRLKTKAEASKSKETESPDTHKSEAKG